MPPRVLRCRERLGVMQQLAVIRPKYISPELFHFVGSASPLDHERNYSILKQVLAAECVSHPPHEQGWGKISYTLDLEKRLAHEELLVPTVTCYCDIPFDQLTPHLAKYGSFGLSFSRHLLTKCGARPVIYVPCRPDDWTGVFTGHTLLRELEATFRGIYEQRRVLEPSRDGPTRGVGLEAKATTVLEALQKAEHALALRVLACVKPYESTLYESDPRYYYSEREWRKLGNFPFEPSNVIHVIVHETYLERAKQELPQYQDLLISAPAHAA